jgi:hypothetical protein
VARDVQHLRLADPTFARRFAARQPSTEERRIALEAAASATDLGQPSALQVTSYRTIFLSVRAVPRARQAA